MNSLSERLNRLTEPQTLLMTRLSRKLRSQGHDIINLSLGEPDFNTPPHIKEAAIQAIKEDYSHYPPVAGYPELREAIATKFKKHNKLDIKPEQVIVSTGAKQSLANIMLAVLSPGDEVLLPAPYWVSYTEMIKLAEGTIKIIPTTIENDFKMMPGQLEAAITPQTKMLVYSSPSNPTGSAYTKEELKQFANILSKHPEIFIVSDEIYEHIVFTGKHESIAQFDSVRNQIIIVNGVSKGFAMTGWRIGYMAAPEPVAKACEKIQGQFTSGASTISQKAAIAALSSDLTYTHQMCHEFLTRRDLAIKMLKDVPYFRTNIPVGAFYLFPKISDCFGKSNGEITIKDVDDLCAYLLNSFHVAVVTGEAFGVNEYIRISYAASEKLIREAIKRIQEAMKKLS